MKLEGKKVAFLGDSITEGAGVSDVSCRYDNVLKREKNLLETYNYGIGGTRFAYQTMPSDKPAHDLYFCGRAYKMNPDADIIVVYGGVNDYLHGDATFGKIGDEKPDTFCGATFFLMKLLKELYSGAEIVFVTPARFVYGQSDTVPSVNPVKKPDAKPLLEYVKVIEETAKQFNIPTLNLYENLGINPNMQGDREKYTVDGLHFNNDGHKVLASLIGNFLESLEKSDK
jgi:lysophospholipase L1-like esterase